MKNFIIFCGLILTALLLSAWVNYPITHYFAESLSKEPHKLINNVGKLFLIALLLIFLYRRQRLNKTTLGYALPRRPFLIKICQGWLVGVAILGGLVLVLWLLDVRVFRPLPDDALRVLFRMAVGGLLGGLLIGFIEETFFRGAVFSLLRESSSLFVALLFSGFIYAAMHFISPQPLPEGHTFYWASGFFILSDAFDAFSSSVFLDSFLALFLAGTLLSLIREHQQNIAFAIGVHAGWIFVIKIFRKFTDVNGDSAWYFLVGDYDGIIGVLASGWLGLLAVVFYWFKLRRSSP